MIAWEVGHGHLFADELIQRWFAEDLTEEQVIGQILQVLQELTQRVNDLENRNRPEGVIRPDGKREKSPTLRDRNLAQALFQA